LRGNYGQKRIKALEVQRNQKRRPLFEAQEEIDRKREKLIASKESNLRQREMDRSLFSIRWTRK
jgi:adenine-specific DNA-methyltransferase